MEKPKKEGKIIKLFPNTEYIPPVSTPIEDQIKELDLSSEDIKKQIELYEEAIKIEKDPVVRDMMLQSLVALRDELNA